jgi:hypothetical protein
MAEVTRRQVSRGAAWAVPVLAVGAATPAMAASGCPTITIVGVSTFSGGTQWRVQVNFANFQTGFATYSGSVTLVEQRPNGNTTDRSGTFSFDYTGQGSVTAEVFTPRQGPSWVASITVFLTAPTVCQQTFVGPWDPTGAIPGPP